VETGLSMVKNDHKQVDINKENENIRNLKNELNQSQKANQKIELQKNKIIQKNMRLKGDIELMSLKLVIIR